MKGLIIFRILSLLLLLGRAGGRYKKLLNFWGLDLSTEQAGMFKGISRISKHGNKRSRQAYWLATIVTIRRGENNFRTKYERYIAANAPSVPPTCLMIIVVLLWLFLVSVFEMSSQNGAAPLAQHGRLEIT